MFVPDRWEVASSGVRFGSYDTAEPEPSLEIDPRHARAMDTSDIRLDVSSCWLSPKGLQRLAIAMHARADTAHLFGGRAVVPDMDLIRTRQELMKADSAADLEQIDRICDAASPHTCAALFLKCLEDFGAQVLPVDQWLRSSPVSETRTNEPSSAREQALREAIPKWTRILRSTSAQNKGVLAATGSLLAKALAFSKQNSLTLQSLSATVGSSMMYCRTQSPAVSTSQAVMAEAFIECSRVLLYEHTELPESLAELVIGATPCAAPTGLTVAQRELKRVNELRHSLSASRAPLDAVLGRGVDAARVDLLAARFELLEQPGRPTAGVAKAGVQASLTIDTDYNTLVSDAAKLAGFKTEVVSEMARELKKAPSEIQITSLRSGSTIVGVFIEESDPAKAAALATEVRSGPLSRRIGTYAVTAVEASTVQAPSTSAPSAHEGPALAHEGPALAHEGPALAHEGLALAHEGPAEESAPPASAETATSKDSFTKRIGSKVASARSAIMAKLSPAKSSLPGSLPGGGDLDPSALAERAKSSLPGSLPGGGDLDPSALALPSAMALPSLPKDGVSFPRRT